MSEENSNPRPAKKRPYNKNRRRYNKKRTGADTSANNADKPRSASSNQENRPKTPNSNRRTGPNKSRNRRTQKPLTPAKLAIKHENLLDQYVQARKKYFHLYGRNNTKQLGKSKKAYELALENLRRFESKLRDWQKEQLKEKIDFYPEDRQFSQTHSLEPQGEQVTFSGDRKSVV